MKKLFALGFFLLLAGTVSLAFASKQDEANKAIQVLKSSKDITAKVQAAIEIGNIGQIKKSYAEPAIPYLLDGCKSKDAKFRAAAAEALGKIDPPEDSKAVDVLSDLAKNDSNTDVKVAAIRGLGAMGPAAKSALPTLREIASKEDKKSRLTNVIRDATRAISAKK